MSLPHCKDPDHLDVLNVVHPIDGPVTVTHVASMECANCPPTPGVVLSRRAGKPLDGLHLRPDAVAWMPGQLRTAAANCPAGRAVTIEHLEKGTLRHFVSLTPAEALETATAIEHAA